VKKVRQEWGEVMTDSINDLLVASRFARDSILGPGYHFPDELALAIDLSEVGEQLNAGLKDPFPALSDGDVNAAILARFAVDDTLLVNPETSSASKIISILSKEIAQRRINLSI
jgi:hypothetical protein